MAIKFARIEIINRKLGGNACRKGAYNARAIIADQKLGEVFDFSWKGGNVYHEVRLPEYADSKFKDIAVLMNEVERTEKRKDSQLLKDIVLALPDNKELDLQDRIEITLRTINRLGYIKSGLGVQIDIHEPDKEDKNWHAHLLVTTRRFTEDGKHLSKLKARDLNPEFKTANGKNFIIPEEEMIGEVFKEVQNDYFKEKGLELRVDAGGLIAQEHLGPVRMRSIINAAAERNNIRRIANLEAIKSVDGILERVTRVQAIFSKRDLTRAVKEVEDRDLAEKLVAETLKSSKLIKLYHQDGTLTNVYTTVEVRAEEERILRIASKVNEQSNHSKLAALSKGVKELKDVSAAQREALKEILLNPAQGIRILRGRAGTGKSHVLGKVCQLAASQGQHVIGLAPSHKAKSELQASGYQEAYTTKGFLFRLHNDKVKLPNNSLLVVDEAGMVATQEYQELLKAAWSKNCNLILAGDEKQLTSVERGGMFELLAKKFGSYELSEIRRQSKQWGKELALLFAGGRTEPALAILKEHGALRNHHKLEDSMTALINDWASSDFKLEQRLIITVCNKEVEALNEAARSWLKAEKVLKGEEYSISKQQQVITEDGAKTSKLITTKYMQGERILFTENYQELGIENGDFATLLRVSKDEFIVQLDKDKDKARGVSRAEDKDSGKDKERIISFNPSERSAFKHGYASTVYKAQGASIKDVYVLHNGAGNLRSSYVQMTRHVEEVKLYCNQNATKNNEQLIRQLSRIDEKSASLSLYSQQDLAVQASNSKQTVTEKIGIWFKDTIIAIADRIHEDKDYYKFIPAVESRAKVELALDQVANNLAVATGQIISIKQPATSSRETAIVECKAAEAEIASISPVKQPMPGNDNNKINSRDKELGIAKIAINQWSSNFASDKKYMRELARQQEFMRLKMEVRFNAEAIARSLLGEPNRELSNGRNLRFGKSGKLVLQTSGSKAGLWCDFAEGKGGDLFGLVQREKGCDFKEAVSYLKSAVGMQENGKLADEFKADKAYRQQTAAEQREQDRAAARKQKTRTLYQKSVPIAEADNIASKTAKRYLSQHRGINCVTDEDLRSKMVFDRQSQKIYPAICAFAKDSKGEIIGGQIIYLDYKTANKANIATNKRSFGRIAGAFVEVQKASKEQLLKSEKCITYIAEGVETALSLKEAEVTGKILCSLGALNIKNYTPAPGERIIICADNDGRNAAVGRAIIQAKQSLETKGAIIAVVAPNKEGDFNDVLREEGVEGIKAIITPALEQLSKTTSQLIMESVLVKEPEETGAEAISSAEQQGLRAQQAVKLQEELQAAERLAPERLGEILMTYRTRGVEAATSFARESCIVAISSKIRADHEIMKDKWNNPDSKLSWEAKQQIVIYDFNGKPHTNDYDYLAAIGKDQQVMRYIDKNSPIGQKIESEIQLALNREKGCEREM